MAFPTNPTNGQTTTINGVTYTYSTALTAWTVTSSGGSLTSASALSVTGNVTGGNVLSDGISSATSNIVGGNITTTGQLVSTVATGTAPLAITSTTKVTNLNVEQVDGYHADTANTISTIAVRDAGGNIAGSFFTGSGVSVTGNVTGGNITTAGQVSATGNITGGNIIAFDRPSAGTTALAPILFTSGTNLTNPVAGALEYDGTAIYGTNNTTSGRGEIGIFQEYRYTSAGSALGPTIADYFGASSSLNLQASSYYELDCMAYFLKTTAGTVTWTWAFSSAAAMARSYYVGTVATGFTTAVVTGAPVTGMAIQQTSTALAHAATGSLTTAVYHHFHFKVHIVTTLATNVRLRVTSSAGTVTPQAGSYYSVRKIAANAGTFAA